ncbi:MAG: S1/P1 nuclease [Balneola sp.]
MKKFIASTFIFSFLFSLTINPTSAISWNSTGHRVIAAIAWENLSSSAKTNIMNILKQAPEDSDLMDLYDKDSEHADKYYFMNAAYWPDIVRDRDEKTRYDKYHKGPWHYVGTYWKQTDEGPVDAEGFVDDEHIVERITHFRETLGDPRVSNGDKAVQIAWILHLVGDIHMPLHNTSRITDETPDGDRGGNSFELSDSWPWNLHAYWDGIIDVANPKADGDDDFDYYLANAEMIEKKHPQSEFKGLVELQNSTKWNNEGKQITMNNLYPEYLNENQQPPAKYKEMAYEIAQKRIALSGYRMAEFLNNIFGK